MELYLNSTGIICGAGYNAAEDFLAQPPAYEADMLPAVEPDYKAWIPPMQLRRMNKAVRMGIGATKVCMDQAGDTKPDAIAVGTALGCVEDSGAFLDKMVKQEEQMLTPTAFIQSTHNTVAGQVALVYSCKGPNLTFTHRGHSFEHVLLNTQLYLLEHPDAKVLVGGMEEQTPLSLAVLRRSTLFSYNKATPEKVINGSDKGAMAGEGCCFFMASGQPMGEHFVCIKDISLFHTRAAETTLGKINDFISRNNIDLTNIDLVMLGISGDEKTKPVYDHLRNDTFRHISQAAFKHLSGEFATASSFALGILMEMVKKGTVLPPHLLLGKAPGKLKKVLLINSYAFHHSCYYIELS